MKKYKPVFPFFIFFLLLWLGASSCSALPAAISAGGQPAAKPTTPATAGAPVVQLKTTAPATATAAPLRFDGERALQDAAYQLAAGPRSVGSPAHREIGDWIAAEARKAGWQVEIQETRYQGQPVRNIIAKWGQGEPWVVLGAHYDSRLAADRDLDPLKQSQPVPGANDGASGVAVLLELARTLPTRLAGENLPISTATPGGDGAVLRAGQIWLVFFDSEDNGRLPGWDWILGSSAFVTDLQDQAGEKLPDAAVIVDMIGDKDLNIPFEQSSDPILKQEIWAQAAALGYSSQFLSTDGLNILDDHTPFLKAGIPAVDLIDFSYPFYHTSEDTLDKISAQSLQAVGDTLTAWLVTGSSLFRR